MVAAVCQSVVAGNDCAVPAIGRCRRCGKAFCLSHACLPQTDQCGACSEAAGARDREFNEARKVRSREYVRFVYEEAPPLLRASALPVRTIFERQWKQVWWWERGRTSYVPYRAWDVGTFGFTGSAGSPHFPEQHVGSRQRAFYLCEPPPAYSGSGVPPFPETQPLPIFVGALESAGRLVISTGVNWDTQMVSNHLREVLGLATA